MFSGAQAKQSILQEPICAGVVGGRLDFPQSASFAAVKVVMWWEDEFAAGFRRNSGLVAQKKSAKPEESAEEGEEEIVKNSDPGKFANAVIKSAEQLLGKTN